MSKQHGPWKILDTIEKYQNPWMKVHEDQVVRPDGKLGIYGVVTIKSDISILAIDDVNRVHLTREFHYAVGEETIETVSGGIDAGEQPLEAAKRELKEELGISAQTWTDLGTIHPITSMVNLPMTLYIAQDLSFGSINHEGTELITAVIVPLETAVDMVFSGQINHCVSCLLILKAAKLLSRISYA